MRPEIMASDAAAKIGTSPDNTPNAAPRFWVYSSASQPPITSNRVSERPAPIVETMRDFVNWSIMATAAAIPTRATVSLRAGTKRLIALDQRLALDTIGNVGERF